MREFQLSIEAIEGEVSEKNNVSVFAVETVMGKIRLLLADMQSRWEYRYLQILFARDKRVEADEYIEMPHLHTTGQVEAIGGLPETVEQWAHYDVVMLGDLELSQASRQSLETFVRQRAGKLIVIAGKNHMPQSYLSDPFFELLPIRRQPSSHAVLDPLIEITREGLLHPAMQIESTELASRNRWRLATERVPMGFVSPWSTPSDSARVLAMLGDANAKFDLLGSAKDSSMWLSWHRVGSGHVVYFTSPSAYKLRFRGGDTYHHRFWGQMLRWLMAADLDSQRQLVFVQTDKSNYVEGDTIQVSVQLRTPAGYPRTSEEVSVAIIASNDGQRIVSLREDTTLPGTYRTEIRGLHPDVYQLKPVGAFVEEAAVDSPDTLPAQVMLTVEQVGDVEQVMTSANFPLMAEIAAATGGQLVTPAAAEEVLRILPLEERVKTVEQRTPIWNRWPLLCLVAGCLSTEWIVRKWKGLV